MALWTDIVEPAELTGYARASLADFEQRRGTLARYLPYREVADIVARFVVGSTGLIDTAKFRAFDAEPETGRAPSGRRVTLELPALGQELPVTEYQQLRQRNASDDAIRNELFNYTARAARAVAETLELLRGVVLNTGRATINPSSFGGSFQADDDFGRSAGNSVTAAAAWSGDSVDILGDIQSYSDAFLAINGELPGSYLTSTRIVRAMAKNKQFATALVSGSSRPATLADLNATLAGNDLPQIVTYDRQVSVDGVKKRVIPDDRFLLLPAPVETDDWEGTQLGATYIGQTLTSMDADYGIADVEQPGVVVGAYRNEKPPLIAQIISDAIGMPVLANADLSFVADVL